MAHQGTGETVLIPVLPNHMTLLTNFILHFSQLHSSTEHYYTVPAHS